MCVRPFLGEQKRVFSYDCENKNDVGAWLKYG